MAPKKKSPTNAGASVSAQPYTSVGTQVGTLEVNEVAARAERSEVAA